MTAETVPVAKEAPQPRKSSWKRTALIGLSRYGTIIGLLLMVLFFSINAPGGGLNVLNGCEGTEALFLLLAAFLVAPLPWRSRFGGFLLGVGMVFVVNQLRILALFYAYRADHALFDPLHGTVAPILVILLVAGYFYGWLLYSRPRSTVPI